MKADHFPHLFGADDKTQLRSVVLRKLFKKGGKWVEPILSWHCSISGEVCSLNATDMSWSIKRPYEPCIEGTGLISFFEAVFDMPREITVMLLIEAFTGERLSLVISASNTDTLGD